MTGMSLSCTSMTMRTASARWRRSIGALGYRMSTRLARRMKREAASASREVALLWCDRCHVLRVVVSYAGECPKAKPGCRGIDLYSQPRRAGWLWGCVSHELREAVINVANEN